MLSRGLLDQHGGSQQFCHAPGLRDTAARLVGRVAIEHFMQLPEAVVRQLRQQRADGIARVADRSGAMGIGGDDSADTAASILSGAFHTSVAGGTVVTSYDGDTDITSTFVQVVPEPTSLALLMMAGIASVMFRRRKGSSRT